MKKEIIGFFDGLSPRLTQTASLAMLLIMIVGAGWYGWHWYIERKGAQAQQLMSDCMDEYRKAQTSTDSLWKEVELASSLAHTQAAGTSLEPFFVIMQAQAQAAQGNVDTALELMGQALAQLPTDSVYRSYFLVTQALLKLTASSEAVVHDGLQQLQTIAADEKNLFADLAAYQLGQWYWLHDKTTEAKEFWQRLADNASLTGSPWREQAVQKLAVL